MSAAPEVLPGPMTSTEESTVAPDTPGSSDVSAPSAGATSGPRRITAGAGASSRLCRALGKDATRPPVMARVFREEKREEQAESGGARSVPAPGQYPRSLAPVLARPAPVVAEVFPRSARALGTKSAPGVGPRLRTVPGPGRTGTAVSPPRQSPARSPARSRGNSPSSPRLRSRKELEQHKVALEMQIEEANRSRLSLERMLTEERSRGAADRAKLAALGARIEQLEQSRGQTGPRVLQENRTLHTELEAQSQQIEVLRQQVQLLRDGHMAEPQLQEENLRLRRDLEHSRAMLSRYTDELATIMPGMQKVIQKFQGDLQPGRCAGEFLDAYAEDLAAAEGTSSKRQSSPPVQAAEHVALAAPARGRSIPQQAACESARPSAQESTCDARAVSSCQRAAANSVKDQKRAGSPNAGPAGRASSGLQTAARSAGRLSSCLSRLADETLAVQRRSSGAKGRQEPPGLQQPRPARRTPSPVERKASLCSVAEEPPRWRF
ncbi:unnamed protein product [Symbiodinium natans]|uniref:Uncharacterized protein n=1 Tax=Symbiodinium natans TaxID=878477 RepID=A0A812ILE4_9DINO|nr:unnamed protein product [Symbiodinium natans]